VVVPPWTSAALVEETFVTFVWWPMEELLHPLRRIVCDCDSNVRSSRPPHESECCFPDYPGTSLQQIQLQWSRSTTLPCMKWYGSLSECLETSSGDAVLLYQHTSRTSVKDMSE